MTAHTYRVSRDGDVFVVGKDDRGRTKHTLIGVVEKVHNYYDQVRWRAIVCAGVGNDFCSLTIGRYMTRKEACAHMHGWHIERNTIEA